MKQVEQNLVGENCTEPRAPLVDVIIPSRNGGKLLAEAIESVLCQTMPRFRLVVVDNNSTDGTPELIRSFSDPRLEIIRHAVTHSLFENINFCLSVVRAPYFCLLHADDRLRPDYIECMVTALKAEPRALLAACQVMTIDGAGRDALNFKYRLKNRLFLSVRRVIGAGSFSSMVLRSFNFMVAPSLLYRREVLEKIGCFRDDMLFFSDLEYLDRGLWRGARYLIVPRILFEYRLHGEQETSSLTRNLFKYKETLKYFSELVEADSGQPNRRRLPGVAAEARVALVVLWDYMNSEGQSSGEHRAKAVRYLLETPILAKCIWLWRLLDRAIKWPKSVRRVICSGIMVCLLLPVIGYCLVWQ